MAVGFSCGSEFLCVGFFWVGGLDFEVFCCFKSINSSSNNSSSSSGSSSSNS